MKNITKFLAIMTLLLVSSHSNANIGTIEKATLVTKMCNNTTVIKLYKNKLITGLIRGIDIDDQLIKNEISAKIAAVNIENQILYNSMMVSFPDYASLTPEDKVAVTKEILNSAVMYSAFWDCIATRTNTFVVAIAGSGALAAVIARIKGCLYASLIVDLAGEAVTEGAATPLVAGAAVAEVNFCKWLAGITTGVSSAIVFEYIASIFSC